mgnify:FL=1
MALSIDEIIRLRNRLAAQRIANEAMADSQREQAQATTATYDVPGGGERETADPRNPFAAAGIGALKFLDTLAAGGGGGVRRIIQGFQPGEQSVERELREISQERGPTRNPWESFKRQGEASRRTEDTHLWDTPFDFAAKGSKFNPLPFSYLPQNVTSRGLAEVAGDPLNLAIFAPFVGAPLRAAEGAVFGAAKGALSGTLGSVGRGLGAGGGTRTLGSVAKGVAAAPTRGLGRAVTEAGRGASGSLDLERRLLGRNIFGRNTVRPPATSLADEVTAPDIGDFNPGTKYIDENVSDGIEKSLDEVADVGPTQAKTILKPDSRAEKAFGIFRGPGFRETFGRSRLGVSFAERISGLKGIISNAAEGPLRQAAKMLDRFNKRVTTSGAVVSNKATAFSAAETELTKIGIAIPQDDAGYYRNIFIDDAGNPIPWETLDPSGREAAFSIHIYETLGKNYDRSTKKIKPSDDGSVIVDEDYVTFDVPTSVKNAKGEINPELEGPALRARLHVDQAHLITENQRWLHQAGIYGFRRQIDDLLKLGSAKYKDNKGNTHTVNITNDDEALEYIKMMGGVDGVFVPHMFKKNPNFKDEVDGLTSEDELWDSLIFTRERMGRQEGIEKKRNLTTLQASQKILDGELIATGTKLSDITIQYGEQAIRIRNRDDLERSLKFQWLKLSKEQREKKLEQWETIPEDRNWIILERTAKSPTGRRVAGWTDNEIIYINPHKIRDDFKAKKWTNPDVEDVDPLPLEQFKTEAEYREFVEYHEKAHIIAPRVEGETLASYENRMNSMALAQMERKDIPRLVTEQYEDILKSERSKTTQAQLTNLELQAQAFLRISPETANLLKRHYNVTERGGWSGFTKAINDEIFGPLRGLRAGIDFGFMGINTLPLLFIRPLDYAKVWKRAILSIKKDRYEKYVWDNLDDFDDMAAMGVSLNKYSTDVYDNLRNSSGPLGIFGRFPGGRNPIETKLVGPVQEHLERSFYASMDSARHYLYKSYKPLWENVTDPAERALLRESLSEFINYSTGGFSAVQQGISPTQRDLEASWIFFSPRYTRASMALIAKAFGGDVGGVEARRILTNALTVAIPIYIHTARSLGQEPELDPTSGAFLTIKIDGDYIGPATFFRQFATLSARLISDPEAVAFMDDRPGVTFKDRVFNNPIIKFFRGRTPISTSLATDIATGSDFLGQELETPVDWSKHFAGQALPFWAEGLVFNNGFDRAGVPSIVSEVLGSRSFPSSPYNKRTELRDMLAIEEFEMEWEQLTDNEKLFIRNKQKEENNPELDILDEQVRELRMGRDEGFDRLMEEKKVKSDAINEAWNNTVRPLVEAYAAGDRTFSLGDIAKFAKEASRNRRVSRRKLQKEEDSIAIDQYFRDRRANGDIAQQHADELVQEYYERVIEASEKDVRGSQGEKIEIGVVDYAMRDKLQQDFFRDYPGMEEYIDTSNYLTSALSNQSPLMAEYYQGLEDFRYYWDGSENAVFNTMPQYEAIRLLYDEWQRGTSDRQKQLELDSPMLKNLLSTLRRVRESMRKQDILLDRFLVRWQIGGVKMPKHPHNILVYGDDIEKGREAALLAHNYDWRIQDMP